MTPAGRSVRDALTAELGNVERISVRKWVEENIVLPTTVSQTDGPMLTLHCPYVRAALEDFRDPTLSVTTWCWGAQTFKTTTLIAGAAYKIKNHPENFGWFMPNEKLIQSFVETRWNPVLASSPAVAGCRLTGRSKNKILEQQFDRCIGSFIPCGSERNLKSRSMGVAILDEIDDIEAESNANGDSFIRKIESRTKSFVGSKIFKTGTPTIPTGASWSGFMEGDRQLFFVPCPHCKKETTLEFSPEYTKQYFLGVPATRIVWGEDAGAASCKLPDGSWNLNAVAQSARIKCPHCLSLWTEGDKVTAVRIAESMGAGWKPTNPNAAAGKRSRRLPSIYAPHQKTTISALAVRFIESMDKPGGVRNFLNEELALPYVPKGTTVTKSDITRIVEHSPQYLIGEVPRESLALMTMTVDVQQTEFWWTHRALFGDSASALIDYGQAISWADLLEIYARKYPIKGTARTASCLFALIDSGFRARRSGGVYDFCLGDGAGRFFPCQGRSSKGHGFSKTVGESDQDHKGQAFKLIQLNDDIFKHDLYLTKIKSEGSTKWWLPRNLGRDYEAQLTDEYLTPDDGWKTRSNPANNHLGDCEKMQLIIPGLLKEKGMALLARKMSPGTG